MAESAENAVLETSATENASEEKATTPDTADAEKAEVLIPEIEPEPSTEVVVREPARIESVSDEEDDEDDDFEDETLIERLVGLTEMFPTGLTSAVNATANGAVSSVKWMYSASRSISWVVQFCSHYVSSHYD